jgi:type IV secretory pathway TrbD component
MAMPTKRRINATHKAINKPLTILGAERKLFFVALIMGAAAFNLLGSLLDGILLFACLFLLAQWATRTDPQILRILLQLGQVPS